MTSDSIRRFVPAPVTCFFLAGFLVLLGGSFASSTSVVRERLDDSGHVIIGTDGQPLIEIDQWASYWNGWAANLPLTAALGFLCFGFASFLWRLAHKAPNQPKQEA